MNIISENRWKQRALFFGLGVGTFALSFFLSMAWYWPGAMRFIVSYLSWIVLAVVCALDIQRRDLTRTLAFFGGLVCVYVMLMLYLFVWPEVNAYMRQMSFDAASWQDQEQVYDQDPVRLRMVESLLSEHSLIGMTREQLFVLLGPGEPDGSSTDTILYWLGPEQGLLGLEDQYLKISLENDIITAVERIMRRE